MPDSTLLKVLRVLSWPYRFPPLSWMAALIAWLAATPRRFWTFVVVAVVAQMSLMVALHVR